MCDNVSTFILTPLCYYVASFAIIYCFRSPRHLPACFAIINLHSASLIIICCFRSQIPSILLFHYLPSFNVTHRHCFHLPSFNISRHHLLFPLPRHFLLSFAIIYLHSTSLAITCCFRCPNTFRSPFPLSNIFHPHSLSLSISIVRGISQLPAELQSQTITLDSGFLFPHTLCPMLFCRFKKISKEKSTSL